MPQDTQSTGWESKQTAPPFLSIWSAICGVGEIAVDAVGERPGRDEDGPLGLGVGYAAGKVNGTPICTPSSS